MSARLSASRDGALEKNQGGVEPLPSASSARRRAAARGGRNPANRNASGGRPERISAVSAAEGPGAAVTGRSSASAARTSLKPGSETSGVPASDTSASLSPRRSAARMAGRTRSALWS